MADKLQNLLDLAVATAQNMTQSVPAWTAYLQSAARLYKYPFHEQILIHAQNPEASACASMEVWNRRMYRYVRRRAKGIALIDDTGSALRLKYVFDLADTRPVRDDIPEPYLWEMQSGYENAVLDGLTHTFGAVKNVGLDFNESIYVLCKSAMQDHLQDYLEDFLTVRAGSRFAPHDEKTSCVLFEEAATTSAAYVVLARCGVDAFFKDADFDHVLLCDTLETAELLGTAVSDISAMVLREVERTVKGMEGQKRFDLRRKFANQARAAYAETNRTTERSGEHGDDIQTGGRLPDSRPDADRHGSDLRQVREDAQALSTGAPERAVQPTASGGRVDGAPERDRPDGKGTDGTDRPRAAPDQPAAGQSDRPAGLDGTREQPDTPGRGNDTKRTALQITDEPEKAAFSGSFLSESEGEQLSLNAPPDDVSRFPDEAEQAARARQAAAQDARPLQKPALMKITTREWKRLSDQGYVSEIDGEKFILRGGKHGTTLEPVTLDDEHGLELQKYTFTYAEETRFALAYTEQEARSIMEADHIDPAKASSLQAETYYSKPEEPPHENTKARKISLAPPDMSAYRAAKAAYPDLLIGVTIENMTLFYGEDAKKAAPALGGKLIHQIIPGIGQTVVAGTPHGWATALHKVQAKGLGAAMLAPDPDGAYQIAKVRALDVPPLAEAAPVAAESAEEKKGAQTSRFQITDENLGIGSEKAKFEANIAAIQTLKQIEQEARLATPEEQEILSRYVGWGGLPQAFDAHNAKWQSKYALLERTLTPEEFEAARASTLNAHYTSPAVIRAIYQAVANLGFQSGNVLEPAMGIGNFFGMLPESMAASRLYGVELDGVTGRIAKQLYPSANIQIKGFEETDFPDDFFDLAIGNVPFGAYQLTDPRYDKQNLYIHDYFFVKTLDKVRPGGVVAFITSHGTMDKQDSRVRQYLANRAALLGAIRLPHTAFQANAGTSVTTDILFLQKRDRVVEAEADWIGLGETNDGIPVNAYFAAHPEMVLGTMVYRKNMYGNDKDTACEPFAGANLSEQLTQAVQNIHGEIPVFAPLEELAARENDTLPADPEVRSYSFTDVGGKLYFREDSIMTRVYTTKTGESRIRGMMRVRDAARALLDAQLANCTDEALHTLQGALHRAYDDYTGKYGILNSRGNKSAFEEDSSYPLLCALEELDEAGNFRNKTAIFTKRTIRQRAEITHASTAAEALAASLAEKACVDLPYLSALLGRSGETSSVIKELRGQIFKDPSTDAEPFAGWQTADEYLSGDVRKKLALAEHYNTVHAGRYAENVEALRQVQPRPLAYSEIDVRLGATWIPPEIIRDFLFELLGTPPSVREEIKVLFFPQNATWHITGKSADRENVGATMQYGTARVNAYQLAQNALNLRDTRVFDTKQGEDGKPKRVLHQKDTMLAQSKQTAICNAFRDWIWKDAARREALSARYNALFNAIRPRAYDGSHIRFDGMNPEIQFRKHQKDVVARILYGGNTLMAHCVGAGKTWAITASIMEGKRLGLCQKSLIVVPNHLTGQWGAEFLQLYPSANILVATEKDFEKQNRRKLCARIATGSYDAVIIGHSQLIKIPMPKAWEEKQIREEIHALVDAIQNLKREKAEAFTIKQMERTRKSLQERLKKLGSARRDQTVTFDQLGIDRLYIDEADEFKNLHTVTKMQGVAGIMPSRSFPSNRRGRKCQRFSPLGPNAASSSGSHFASSALHTKMYGGSV